MNMPFVLCVVAAFMWAIANILAKYLLKDLSTRDIFSINFLLMAAWLLLVSPLFYKFDFSIELLLWVVVIGLIDTLSNYFYFESLKHNDTSTITPVLSLSPIFTFIVSGLFVSENISLLTYIVSICIVLLVVLFSLDQKSIRTLDFTKIKYALLSSLLFGISAVPAKYVLTTLWTINAPTLYMFRAGIIGLFALLFFGFTIPRLSIKDYRFISLRSLVVIIQWVLFYYSISQIPVGVWSTIFSITPIFVFLLSFVFLKEQPTLKKLVSSGLIVLASIIIYFII